jgi:hypothetical protein
MIEAITSAAITLVIFAIGYGRLIEKIENLKQDVRGQGSDIHNLENDIKTINDLRVDLAEIKKDIHYIKEKI